MAVATEFILTVISSDAAATVLAFVDIPWALDTINGAMQVLSQDYTPLTDMRASASYRLRVAQNLLLRFYLEFTTNPYPVRLGLRYEQTGFETK